MASVPDSTVRRELLALLRTVDFEEETERTVRKKLALRLKCDLDDRKPLIKTVINEFLEAGAAAEEEGEGAEDYSEDLSDEDKPAARAAPRVAPRGGKRKAAGEAASRKTRPEKIVAPTGVMGKGKWNAEGEWVTSLSDAKRVAVRSWKSQVFVDVREYYQKDGDWLPTKKGISLPVAQWKQLKAAMGVVLVKIQQGLHNHVVQLSDDRKLTLRTFKGHVLIDIREFYAKGNEWLPTKKGASLNADLFATLSKRTQDVDTAIEALGGDPSGVEAPAGGPLASAPTAADEETEGFSVPLGGDIRVDVGSFNGKVLVGIRHWAQKNGKLAPGYKGISLMLDQFETLVEHATTISQALKSFDKSLEVSLSSKRKVTISMFTGQVRVDIREYYGGAGDLKPGKKGISLQDEQWGALLEAADRIRREADNVAS
eukprot:CAMPEP_0117650156 /NCGR_PEP_ID=MMETSP0804-20121206/1386_1 /TAXON_ID=1074897 /ORGANISM="Tetraselmis astigmatica, Strain CCMP880" /LENGTH=427 /DNA_ID=CAMNT_0005456003 /DNA_START=206 /DNA_END=1489 /DNA_ORIENTATION=+